MFDNMLLELTFKNRGYPDDYLTRISNARHRVLANTDIFVERLHQLHDSGDLTVILSDFDMDGISAGTLGYAGLAELGFNVSLYLVDPTSGYGFSSDTIRDIYAKYGGRVRTIITCDVGITCNEAIDTARELGIEVLLTDHHEPDSKKALPNAYCVIDPKCENTVTGYEHPDICGAYVLYQLIESYATKYYDRMTVEQIKRLQVFAGMGTISDGMPLLYENRRLVQDAMSIAKLIFASGSDFVVNYMSGCDQYRRAFRGLYLLLKAFVDAGKLKSVDDITSEFFAFYVAPTFNSVKRIGKSSDMEHAFGVFFGPDPEGSVAYLMNLNTERKAVVSEYFKKMQGSVQPYAPYVYLSDASGGILGLLAQKQMELTGLPCLVITSDKGDGSWHGSGRAPGWYAFRSRALEQGFYVAGHEGAFGAGFKNNKELRRFYEFVRQDVEMVRQTVDLKPYELRPDFIIDHSGAGDTVIDIVLFMDYIDEMSRLGPFGAGFPAPQVLLRFNAEDAEWITRGAMKQHAFATLAYGFEVALFNQAHLVEDMRAENPEQTFCVLGHLAMNRYHSDRTDSDIETMQFVGDIIVD